jgi:hypothetical protein
VLLCCCVVVLLCCCVVVLLCCCVVVLLFCLLLFLIHSTTAKITDFDVVFSFLTVSVVVVPFDPKPFQRWIFGP